MAVQIVASGAADTAPAYSILFVGGPFHGQTKDIPFPVGPYRVTIDGREFRYGRHQMDAGWPVEWMQFEGCTLRFPGLAPSAEETVAPVKE
jgi:hypothetical protein